MADFDHLTPQIAEERVTNARDALNALHRVQAISESEQEAAERAGGGIYRRIGVDTVKTLLARMQLTYIGRHYPTVTRYRRQTATDHPRPLGNARLTTNAAT